MKITNFKMFHSESFRKNYKFSLARQPIQVILNRTKHIYLLQLADNKTRIVFAPNTLQEAKQDRVFAPTICFVPKQELNLPPVTCRNQNKN